MDESMPPPPPPPPDAGTPSSSPPPPGKKTLGGRFRELLYPLAIAVTSFIISFVVGVGAALAVATGLASSLLALVDDGIAYGWQLFDVYQRLGLLAVAGTFANAIATIVDNRLEEVATKYKPESFDTVIKGLLVGGRENVPAYRQYPFLGMILVPAMTAVLFVFMFGIRIVRNLRGYQALVNAAGQLKK
ncbi:hypothetical protein Sste5344_003573 [Sporothrix stenoceras]